MTTATCAVPVTPSARATIVVDPGPVAVRNPGPPTGLSGDPMTATAESFELKRICRPVIVRPPCPTTRASTCTRSPRPRFNVPGVNSTLLATRRPIARSYVPTVAPLWAVRRTVPGRRSARMSPPTTLASVVSLTVQVTAAGTSAPASSTTVACSPTTSPSKTLSANGTTVTEAPVVRIGAALSLQADMTAAAMSARALMARFTDVARIDRSERIPASGLLKDGPEPSVPAQPENATTRPIRSAEAVRDSRGGHRRSESVVDVHDRHPGRTAVEHRKQRRESAERRAVPHAGRHRDHRRAHHAAD